MASKISQAFDGIVRAMERTETESGSALDFAIEAAEKLQIAVKPDVLRVDRYLLQKAEKSGYFMKFPGNQIELVVVDNPLTYLADTDTGPLGVYTVHQINTLSFDLMKSKEVLRPDGGRRAKRRFIEDLANQNKDLGTLISGLKDQNSVEQTFNMLFNLQVSGTFTCYSFPDEIFGQFTFDAAASFGHPQLRKRRDLPDVPSDFLNRLLGSYTEMPNYTKGHTLTFSAAVKTHLGSVDIQAQ